LQRAEAIALRHRPTSSGQQLAPSNLPDIWQELAFALSQKGMTDEALTYIDKMSAEPGADPYEVLVMRGHLLMEGGRLEDGQACYMKAISDSAGAPQVFLRIAISIYDLGYYQHSYRMFQILRDCTDDSRTDGYAYEALCCYALGRYDEFKENVRLACEKNPTEAQMVLAEFFPPELGPQDYYQWLLDNNP
jgi:tetratricopeptide (TPR) repeat protein